MCVFRDHKKVNEMNETIYIYFKDHCRLKRQGFTKTKYTSFDRQELLDI